jgi:protein-ribulosamine 3-kinase
MVSGEFASMKSLHDTVQYLTPIPIAWGTYAADPNIHFFLCEFVDMTEDIPDPQALGIGLAELHTKGLSPNGKYGFSVPTLQGTIPQYTEWTDSWEEFFTRSTKKVFEAELKSQGSNPEILALEEAIITKVIPRLLRPLETGGRKIEPRLIHGDIWDGNVSTNIETDLPVIFDATCIYAHNERKSPSTKICPYS